MAKLVIQSILYMFGLEKNPIQKHPQKSDKEWLEADWTAVGNDIRNAMFTYGQSR